MSKQRIGLVDARLDNFHAKVYLSAVRGPLASRGYQIVGATALEANVSSAWASENELTYFPAVEALASEVDHFMVLAPSNPELHLEMCQSVFLHGKPTFVDKTFAPDLATATAIFQLADAHGVAVQSSSALRSSTVQKKLAKLTAPLESMFITSGGSAFEEYGIHPVELAVSCLGADAHGLMRTSAGEHLCFVIKFSGGRTATIDFNQVADVPYTATLVTNKDTVHVAVDTETLFVDAAANILDFFDSDESQVDRRETLLIRRILDVAMSDECDGKFVSLTDSSEKHDLPRTPHWVSEKATQT